VIVLLGVIEKSGGLESVVVVKFDVEGLFQWVRDGRVGVMKVTEVRSVKRFIRSGSRGKERYIFGVVFQRRAVRRA
jgi:hypothetical protein